jgi:tetratricopeptide (TPR) repeat protein
MWQATQRMIVANPISGVGAGAWEVQIPLYQDISTQVESDYYAHNEPLQLIAEYGITGWLFLLVLLTYLGRAARQTWRVASDAGKREAPQRAFTLASLMVFLLVSNAGFPWRMATTGALFALCLAILAASDIRLRTGQSMLCRVRLKPVHIIAALCVTAVCTGLAIYMAQQAIECEAKLVRATKMALTIAASGVPNDPGWANDKAQLVQLLHQGIAINPHYRKITPMAADAMASWGDWENATWVWESVLTSRPYVVVMLANAARGQLQAGNIQNAQSYIDRAKKIQPSAASLSSLQMMLWSRTGHEQEAMQEAKTLLQNGMVDRDLVQTAYFLGLQQHQPELAILALERGIQAWPNRAVDGWLKLGDIYTSDQARDPLKAQNAYQEAFKATAPAYKAMVLNRIPASYRVHLELPR